MNIISKSIISLMLLIFSLTSSAGIVTWDYSKTQADDVSVGSSKGSVLTFGFELNKTITGATVVVTLPEDGDEYVLNSAGSLSPQGLIFKTPVWNPQNRTITFATNDNKIPAGVQVYYKLERIATTSLSDMLSSGTAKVEIKSNNPLVNPIRHITYNYLTAYFLLTAPPSLPVDQVDLTLRFGDNCQILNPHSYTAKDYKFKLACYGASVDSVTISLEIKENDVILSNWHSDAGNITEIIQTHNGGKTNYLLCLAKADLPGGDGFDDDESIIISVKVAKLRCGSQDVAIFAYWGDQASISNIGIGSFSANPSAGGDPLLQAPSWNLNTPNQFHMDGRLNLASSKIRNNGGGLATDLKYSVRNFDYSGGGISYIDTASIRCKVGNGVWEKPRKIIVVDSTKSSLKGDYDLRPDFIGLPSGVEVYINQAVPAGAEVTVEWGFAYPAQALAHEPDKNIHYLLGQRLIDNWTYSNICAEQEYETFEIVSSPFLMDTLVTASAPLSFHLGKDQKKTLTFDVKLNPMNDAKTFVSDQARFAFRIAVREGLRLNVDSIAYWSEGDKNYNWPISNLSQRISGDTTIYTFDLIRANRPPNGLFYQGDIRLNFEGVCSGNNMRHVVEIFSDYYPSGTNTGGGRGDVVFKNILQFYQYITVSCGDGEGVGYFIDIERLTIGWKDDNNDGIPDALGVKADKSKLNHLHLIPNDSLKISFSSILSAQAIAAKKLYVLIHTDKIGYDFNLLSFHKPTVKLNGQINEKLKIKLIRDKEITSHIFGAEKYVGYAWELSFLSSQDLSASDVIDVSIGAVAIPSLVDGTYPFTLTTLFYATLNGVVNPFLPGEHQIGDVEYKKNFTYYRAKGLQYSSGTGLENEFNGRETKATKNAYYYFTGGLAPGYGPFEYRHVSMVDSVKFLVPKAFHMHDKQDFGLIYYLGTQEPERYFQKALLPIRSYLEGVDTVKVYKLGDDYFDVNWTNDNTKASLPDGYYAQWLNVKITSPMVAPVKQYKFPITAYVNSASETANVPLLGGKFEDFFIVDYKDPGSIRMELNDPSSKDVLQENISWQINLNTSYNNTSNDVWLYLDGPVSGAKLTVGSATYIGQGQDGRWIHVPSIAALSTISGSLSMIYRGAGDCGNDNMTVYSFFDRDVQTSGTWQPYPVLNNSSFNKNNGFVNSILTVNFLDVPSRIYGSISPLAHSAKHPSNLSSGLYGLSTIKVGPTQSPKHFPFEVKFTTEGGLGAVKNVRAVVNFPKGIKYLANSAYIEYEGQNIAVAGSLEQHLRTLHGTAMPKNLLINLGDASNPLLGANGEILGGKVAVLRMLLEPTCEIGMLAHKISLNIFGNKICGLAAIGNGEHTYSSSSLQLRDFITSFDATLQLKYAPVANFSCEDGKSKVDVSLKFRKITKADVSVTDSIIISMPRWYNIEGNISYALPAGLNPNNQQIIVPAESGVVSAGQMVNRVVGDERSILWTLPKAYFDALAANNIAGQPEGSKNAYTFKLAFDQTAAAGTGGVFHAAIIASVSPSEHCPKVSGKIVHVDSVLINATNATTWNGSLNSDWNNVDNWSAGIPGKCTDVIIEYVANLPSINSQTKAVAAKVHFDAHASIGGVPHLTYTSSTAKMGVRPNRWYLLSSPYQNMYSGDYVISPTRLLPTVYMRKYQASYPDNASIGKKVATWTRAFSFQNELLSTGNGFAVWVDDDINSNAYFSFPKDSMAYARYYNGTVTGFDVIPSRANNGRFVYEGNPGYNALNKNFSINADNSTDAAYTEMLVANPFMSHLDMTKFYAANKSKIEPVFYVWSSTTFDVGRVPIQTGDAQLGTGDIYIAPMQSFIITKKAGVTDASGLVFTPEMSIAQAGQKLRNVGIGNHNRFNLDVYHNGSRNSGIAIEQNNFSSNGFKSSEDAITIFSDDKNYVESVILSAIVDKRELSINSVLDFSEDIELGIRTKIKGDIVFKISDLAGVLSTENIYLEDRLKGVLHDLRSNPEYTFAHDGGDISARFFLKITKDLTSIDDLRGGDVKIYANEGTVNVSSDIDNPIRRIEIYSTQGSLIAVREGLNTNMLAIDLPYQNQMVVVKVQTEKSNKMEKVLLR